MTGHKAAPALTLTESRHTSSARSSNDTAAGGAGAALRGVKLD